MNDLYEYLKEKGFDVENKIDFMHMPKEEQEARKYRDGINEFLTIKFKDPLRFSFTCAIFEEYLESIGWKVTHISTEYPHNCQHYPQMIWADHKEAIRPPKIISFIRYWSHLIVTF